MIHNNDLMFPHTKIEIAGLSGRAAILVDAMLDFIRMIAGHRPAIRLRQGWWWRWLPGPWRRAHITLGWTLWMREGAVELHPRRAVPLIAHEGVHWIQRFRWGRWGFAWRYALPWWRARIEAEAYAVEAHVYSAMHVGDLDQIIVEMGATIGGWTYLIGPGDHAALVRSYHDAPASDVRAWIGFTERTARESAR